jgi:hypothetical protein
VLSGRGKDERSLKAVSESPRGSFSSDRRDYIASDMFTVVADTEAKRAVVCGFLGEVQDLLCSVMQCNAMHSLFRLILSPSGHLMCVVAPLVLALSPAPDLLTQPQSSYSSSPSIPLPPIGQREQFGCVAFNKAYDHMSVHVDCDGAVRTPKSTGLKSEEVRYNHDHTAKYS